MGIDDINLNAEDVGSRRHALFETAKASDEFEFACTLMRVRGMEDVGWDPFVETHQLVTDLMTLINAPLVAYTTIMLGLLLYRHLTEVGSMYEVLANLTRVVADERYAIDPFVDHYPGNARASRSWVPANKVVAGRISTTLIPCRLNSWSTSTTAGFTGSARRQMSHSPGRA